MNSCLYICIIDIVNENSIFFHIKDENLHFMFKFVKINKTHKCGGVDMNKQVCVFLANGFEEIEGLTVVDLLRRAGIKVVTASITGDKEIHGAHDIHVLADTLLEDVNMDDMDMVILPGGMPGTIHLGEHPLVQKSIRCFYEQEKYIAAICAAPTVFGKMGLLKGRRATCYPGMEADLLGAEAVEESVVVSDFIVTSRGLGTAIDFSLKLIEVLLGEEVATKIGKSIVYL